MLNGSGYTIDKCGQIMSIRRGGGKDCAGAEPVSIAMSSARLARSSGALTNGRAAGLDHQHRPAGRAGSPARLLLIGRDRQISVLLAELLIAHGYAVQTEEDTQLAEDLAHRAHFDLIIADLADANRIECLRRLRRRTCRPVLVLSARMDQADRIAVLENGAEDCLGKPFNPRELLLRVCTVLRHRADCAQEEPTTLKVGPLSLNAVARRLTVGERELELTGSEMRLLELLMRNAGRTVSRSHLTEYALGRAALPFERSLDTHISKLRGKLGSDARGRTPIRTVRGAGYLLLAQWDAP